MELNPTKTNRGFDLIEFHDRYDLPCSIQKSSLATEDAIWFGVTEVEPKIMAQDAIKLGFPTNGVTVGWVGFHVPEEVLMSSRMHLTQDQVKALLPILQRFAATGELT